VVVDAEKKKAKENEREKLFQVKRKKCAQKEFDRADIVRDVRFPVPVQTVDATPSGIKLFSKVVFMRQGRRFGFSAEQKLEVWRRWKAGQTLHEIGRAFGKEHSSIRCLVSRHGGIEISRGLASGSSIREIAKCLERAVSGYWVFSQPEICFGDQSRISLLATMFRNFRLMERRQRLGRKADCQASPSA
jgi:hypothetical protein